MHLAMSEARGNALVLEVCGRIDPTEDTVGSRCTLLPLCSETAAGCAAVGTLFLQIFPLLWGTLVSIRPPEVFPDALVPSADPQTNYVGENISQAQATCGPEASGEMGASMLKCSREEALCMYFPLASLVVFMAFSFYILISK